MNTYIRASIATLVFILTFFIGRQIDMSDQVFAVYEIFQDSDSDTQKASVYEY